MAKILWLDLETTGLRARHRRSESGDLLEANRVLEVAAIVTDEHYVELGRCHAVVNSARSVAFWQLDQAVMDMHHVNGLWMESLRSDVDDAEAGKKLLRLLDRTTPASERPQLGGNTPSFDRGFVEELWPGVAARLSHRHVDVTTLHNVAREAWPAIAAACPAAPRDHRAMTDIEHSIASARYYAGALGPR